MSFNNVKIKIVISSRISGKRGFQNEIQFGSCSAIDEIVLKKFGLSDKTVNVTWINVNNILFKKDFVLQLTRSETDFFQIKYIAKEDSSIYFILQPLVTIGFCEHVQAFEIVNIKKNENLLLKSFDDVNSKQAYNIHFTGNGNSFILTIK